MLLSLRYQAALFSSVPIYLSIYVCLLRSTRAANAMVTCEKNYFEIISVFYLTGNH